MEIPFTEHLRWLLLWFLQYNNLIFSAIMIKLSWKYCNYYHPPYIKIFISHQRCGDIVQKFCCLSRQSPNFMTLWSICFCLISTFFRESDVSHSDTVYLIVSFSKIDCPIYPEENLPRPQKFAWNFSQVIKVHLKSFKIHNVNKN